MIKLKADDITINILPNDSQSTPERDFELLVDYVSTLKEIYDDTKLHEDFAS
jgi:hypothetical protein